MYLIIGWNPLVESIIPLMYKEDEDTIVLTEYIENIPVSEDIFPRDHFINSISEAKKKLKTYSDGTVLFLSEDGSKNRRYASELEPFKGGYQFLLFENKHPETSSSSSQELFDTFVSKEDRIIESLLNEIQKLDEKAKSKQLLQKLRETKGNISVFLHNNPDPDAIASAMAVEKICEREELSCRTYYGGEIGHPENELIMESTSIDMEPIDDEDVEKILNNTETIVFLDFAQASVNNLLPENIKPDIVIDHHFTNREVTHGDYIEIRADVGASSTILTRHLQNLNIEISPLLASVLLYGIKVDTDDYTKNISPGDFKVISYLQAIADEELLDIFESPPLKPNTVNALGRAISNRKFEGGVLTAWMGEVATKDDIPQVADILMRERDVTTVLSFGSLDEKIYMSARCKDVKTNIGKKMKDAFSDIGEGGGHMHSAGGAVPLERYEDLDTALEDIEERFIEEVIG